MIAAIEAKGKLVVGTRFDVTGFALKNTSTGAVEGFDTEMAELIAAAIFGETPADAVGRTEFTWSAAGTPTRTGRGAPSRPVEQRAATVR